MPERVRGTRGGSSVNAFVRYLVGNLGPQEDDCESVVWFTSLRTYQKNDAPTMDGPPRPAVTIRESALHNGEF